MKISASKLKCLESCAVLWWFKYKLYLPEPPSIALKSGSCTHKILEVLSEDIWKDEVLATITAKTLTPKIKDFIIETTKQYGVAGVVNGEEKLDDLIPEMVLNGLLADFYCEGYKQIGSETKFNIKLESGTELNGIIDRLSENNDGLMLVSDFKTNRAVFKGESDLESNTQAMFYSLYVLKKYGKKCKVRFIFLRHRDNPFLELQFTEDELNGFAEYIKSQDIRMEKMNFELAQTDMAAKKDYPKDGGFGGPLLCGRGREIGQLKKNGALLYQCPFKHPFEYYVVGKDKLLVKPESGTFKTMKFDGCPAFSRYRPQPVSKMEEIFDF